jgi:hypothetical protein
MGTFQSVCGGPSSAAAIAVGIGQSRYWAIGEKTIRGKLRAKSMADELDEEERWEIAKLDKARAPSQIPQTMKQQPIEWHLYVFQGSHEQSSLGLLDVRHDQPVRHARLKMLEHSRLA